MISIKTKKHIMNALNSSRKPGVHPCAGPVAALFILIGLCTTGIQAQTFNVIYTFNSTNATGSDPVAPVIQGPDNTLYGTTEYGGSGAAGVVFKVQPDGTGYTVLWNFSGGNDGSNPYAGLLLLGNTLYGTTYNGGSSGYGVIFAVKTDGSGFTNLYSFTGGLDCGNPAAGLIASGGTLYGTTTGESSGIQYYGSIFKIGTNGSGFAVLKTFKIGDGTGANPFGGLVLSGSLLYGTTESGTPGYGTVFRVSTSGNGFTTLHTFTAGSDGGNPEAGLVLASNELYGTTTGGTIFKMTTSGGGFTVLHTLGSTIDDGIDPQAGLILAGTTLYGTTSYGGGYDDGTIFNLNTDGSGMTNLFDFNDVSGNHPPAGLLLSGNTLYGTASGGGASQGGTLFAVALFGPASITNQPLSQIVVAGSTVTFGVGVNGASPLEYQWMSNNIAVAGATNNTLTLTNVSLASSGSSYSVQITNSYFNLQFQAHTNSGVMSSAAVLTVVAALATTQPATGISATGAVLNGSITTASDATLAWFEWGPDTNYGNMTAATLIPGDNVSTSDSTALTGLPGNFYHYRIDATNDFGIVYGNDQSFTVGFPPTATTLAALNSPNGSTLNATVNPRGWDTAVYFKWGVFGGLLTNSTPVVDAGAGAVPLKVGSFITGLTPFKQYNFQTVASNHLGTVTGAQLTFYGPPFVTVPGEDWTSVAASANGSVLVAVANPGSAPTGPIYISTNSGAVWNQATNAPLGRWESVACSADGSKIIAAEGGAGGSILAPIYTSADTGATWVSNNAPVQSWQSVASSADGTKLAVADLSAHKIFTSTNAGATWAQASKLPVLGWYSIATSADGSKLAAVANATYYSPSPGATNIYTSTNFGATWTTNSVPATPLGIQNSWTAIASSADGSRLIAAGRGGNNNGYIFVSTNFGAAWNLTATNIAPGLGRNEWIGVAASADGSRLAAVSEAGTAGGVITSTNFGDAWTTNAVPNLTWNAVALSADGARMVVTVGYPSYVGLIYTTQTTPAPVLCLSAPDNVLSWIIPSLDFTVQQSPDLVNWTDLTNPPVLNPTNLQNQITLPPPNGNHFFRLRN